MIRLSSLGFAYPGQTYVLHDISAAMGRGTLTALVGRNGSGKSTLLTLLAGLARPSAGRLVLDGHTSPGEEKAIRRSAGLVLQEPDLQILGATVGEDLCLGLAHDDAEGLAIARELAERFGLLHAWDEPVQTLSHGQKRKLCLAAMLRARPTVLLLDEPFSGLDYPAVVEMRRILAANRALGLTQVVAAHDLEPLDGLADQWLALDGGKLVAQGDRREVFSRLLEHGVRPPCAWLGEQGLPSWPADLDGEPS